MIIYVYGKCSTCKEALRFLEKLKVEAEVKEITLQPPSIVELTRMLSYQKGNLKKLFNTSGLLYKEMGLSERLESMSEDEALNLLSENGMLVKRPFLLGKDFGLVGFKEVVWMDSLRLLHR